MRFGSHSHSDDPKHVHDVSLDGRERLIAVLRALVDRIERAPLARVSGALASIATSAEAMARSVERALGPDK